MAKAKLNVKLIAFTTSPEQIVASAIRQCYSAVGADEISKKIDPKKIDKLIKQVISSGHTSTIEHASFTFAIEGVSRAMTHQLVRHRIASYSHQSQRYVKEENLDFVIPPKIASNIEATKIFLKTIQDLEKEYKKLLALGIVAEDARYLLPNAAETKIVVTMNARALHNFFKERMCSRAQWEIRNLAIKMHSLVLSEAPSIFANSGPTCDTEEICWQGNLSCGKKLNNQHQQIEVRSRFLELEK
jgi:thymidylate synthase (FAD)